MRTIWTIQDTIHLHTNPYKMHSNIRSEYYIFSIYIGFPFMTNYLFIYSIDVVTIGTRRPATQNVNKRISLFYSGSKRKHIMVIRTDDIGSGSTGLTQEIDIMDIGSSTPKRKKSKSPLKGVLKIRYIICFFPAWLKSPVIMYLWPIDINAYAFCRELSDDEAPTTEHLNNANVMFSTPVSRNLPRNGIQKLKSTRFELPSSEEKSHANESAQHYVQVSSILSCLWESLIAFYT